MYSLLIFDVLICDFKDLQYKKEKYVPSLWTCTQIIHWNDSKKGSKDSLIPKGQEIILCRAQTSLTDINTYTMKRSTSWIEQY